MKIKKQMHIADKNKRRNNNTQINNTHILTIIWPDYYAYQIPIRSCIFLEEKYKWNLRKNMSRLYDLNIMLIRNSAAKDTMCFSASSIFL